MEAPTISRLEARAKSLGGTSSTTIDVPIVEDNLYEGNETFEITITVSTSNANAPAGPGIGTITDDETKPTLTVSNESLVEQDGNMTFTVSNPGAVTQRNINFSYTLAGVTATGGGVDYFSAGAPGTIIGGTTSTTIDVPIVEDDLQEANETFQLTVTVSTSNANNPAGPGIGTITNDDFAGVTVTGSPAATEGDTDTYEVVLDSEPTDDVVIFIATDDQSTITDPAGASLTFTAADWDQPQTVTVRADDDANYEQAIHTSNITHTAASDDTDYDDIGVDPVIMAITDNDPATVQFLDPTSNAQEDSGTHELTVRLEYPRWSGHCLRRSLLMWWTRHRHRYCRQRPTTATPQRNGSRSRWTGSMAGTSSLTSPSLMTVRRMLPAPSTSTSTSSPAESLGHRTPTK